MQITSGRLQKPIKCVLYGPEGIGKSTFAAMAPFPLFCDVEDSTAHMDVRRLPKATSYQMVLDEINYVKANPHLCDTFVMDTADWAERLCRENVCAKNGKTGIEDFGYGKGYSYVYEDFGRLLNALDELLPLGINVIVNAHAVMRKFEQPDEMGAYDRWELKLISSQKCSIANMLKEWADLVLFANYETIVVKNNETKKHKAQGGQRVMYTTHHPCWDAKNRFGLPEKLPFDFRQVAGLFVCKSAAVPDGETVSGGQQAAAPATEEEDIQSAAASNYSTESGKAEEFPVISEKDEVFPFDVEVPPSVYKPLADLMRQHAVSVRELQYAVYVAGRFPADTPITVYPMDFQMYLTTVWNKVLAVVEDNRKEGV